MNSKTLTVTFGVLLAVVTPAFGAGTSTVYNSGILVLAFLGLCALVVVVQLLPALMLLVGMVRGLVKGSAKASEAAPVTSGEKA